MKETRCRMCGLVATMGMAEWIAHRLADFSSHYPWQASRFRF